MSRVGSQHGGLFCVVNHDVVDFWNTIPLKPRVCMLVQAHVISLMLTERWLLLIPRGTHSGTVLR